MGGSGGRVAALAHGPAVQDLAAPAVIAEPMLLGQTAQGAAHRPHLARIAAIGAMGQGHIEGMHGAAQVPQLPRPCQGPALLGQRLGRPAALSECLRQVAVGACLGVVVAVEHRMLDLPLGVVDPQARADVGGPAVQVPLKQPAGPVAMMRLEQEIAVAPRARIGVGRPRPLAVDVEVTRHAPPAPAVAKWASLGVPPAASSTACS